LRDNTIQTEEVEADGIRYVNYDSHSDPAYQSSPQKQMKLIRGTTRIIMRILGLLQKMIERAVIVAGRVARSFHLSSAYWIMHSLIQKFAHFHIYAFLRL